MKDLVDLMSENTFESGIIFIGLSFILLVVTIYRKESLKMREHNTASWKGYVNQLGLIVLLLVYGIILLLR